MTANTPKRKNVLTPKNTVFWVNTQKKKTKRALTAPEKEIENQEVLKAPEAERKHMEMAPMAI